MKLHSVKTGEIHKQLLDDYKRRLDEVEGEKTDEDHEAPFERSFLHNAIYLHNLWFEQLEGEAEKREAPLLEDILENRDSDLPSFEKWLSDFAKLAKPHGWVVWGWSYALKTFVGFPIKSHDDSLPIGIIPLLVIDCWEHSYIDDFGLDFDAYLEKFWRELNWEKIEKRHHELAARLGLGLK